MVCAFLSCLGFFVYLWGFGIVLVNVGLWGPELVPNQRRLFIVVSDWGSYLGCHFPFWFGGLLSALVIIRVTFVLLVCLVFFVNKEECIQITLRLDLIVTANVTEIPDSTILMTKGLYFCVLFYN